VKSASNRPSKNSAYYIEGAHVFHYAIQTFALNKKDVEIGLAKYVKHFYYNISEIDQSDILQRAWSYLETINREKANYFLDQHKKAHRNAKIRDFLIRSINKLLPKRNR